MKFNKKYVEYLFIISFLGNIIFSFIANALSKGNLLILGIFGIEITVILMSIINNKFKILISKNEQMYGVLFVIFQMLMYLLTSISYNIFFLDIHKLIMCVGMIYALYVGCKYIECDKKQLNIIANIVLGVGIFSIIYNFFHNYNYFVPFDFKNIINRGAIFNKSFYSSRAVYGTILNICAMFSLLKFRNNKNFVYILFYCLFLTNVVFTGARAQIIALFIGTVIYLLKDKKYKYLIIIISVIGILYLLITDFSIFSDALEGYAYFFDHSIYKQDADISSGRFDLWKIAFDNMNIVNYLFGLGLGAKDTIMRIVGVSYLDQNLFSFHSGYIDLFFEIGLFGYVIWYGIIIKIYKGVYKSCPTNIRNFLFALLFVILVSNIFDSCSLMFTTDTLSTVTTFLTVTLPLTISNYYKKSEKK